MEIVGAWALAMGGGGIYSTHTLGIIGFVDQSTFDLTATYHDSLPTTLRRTEEEKREEEKEKEPKRQTKPRSH